MANTIKTLVASAIKGEEAKTTLSAQYAATAKDARPVFCEQVFEAVAAYHGVSVVTSRKENTNPNGWTFSGAKRTAAINSYDRLIAFIKAGGKAPKAAASVDYPKVLLSSIKGLLRTYTSTQIRAALTAATAKK